MKHKFTKEDLKGVLVELIKNMLPMITTILVLLLLSGGLL
jgi:hypothetical protein